MQEEKNEAIQGDFGEGVRVLAGTGIYTHNGPSDGKVRVEYRDGDDKESNNEMLIKKNAHCSGMVRFLFTKKVTKNWSLFCMCEKLRHRPVRESF